MIPSERVYLLLLLGIAIAVVLAIVFDVRVSLLATLLFDAIVLTLVVWDGLRVKAHRVQVTRHPLQRLSIGRDNPVVLSVRSGDRVSKIRLRDYYPLKFEVSKPTLDASLTPNSTQELTYTIHPDSRGEFKWGDIQVRQLGRWGLAWNNWKIPASQTVAVYPDLMGLRELSIRLTLQNTGTMRQSRRIGMGTEFAELREYGLGDDTRLIDWKATARRSRPLVRVLEPEREQTLIILLDRGRLMTAQVQGLKRFDWGLNATGLSFYQQALAIFREVGNSPNGDRFVSRSGESSTLASMGEMYSMLGQYAKARDFLQQALTIAKDIGDRSGETYALSTIGDVYSRLGEYPQALDFLQQALAMTQNVGDSPNDEGFTSRSTQGSIYLSMGLVYKNQGQYAEALKLYQQTLTLARELGQRRVEGAALHETGIIYDTLGEYAKALEFYKPVVAITREVGDRAAEALTLTSIGSALLKTGNTVEGSKLLLNAVEIWESMRPGLTDVYKVSIFETQAKTYRDLQQALVAQGKTTQALEIAERGRAKAFVELLALRLSENSTNPLTVKPLTIQDIQGLAKEKKRHIGGVFNCFRSTLHLGHPAYR